MQHEDAMQFQTVDREFNVMDSDTVPAIIDASLAEVIARGKSDWHALQKKSVSIRRYKIEMWKLQEIAGGVYRWTLGYDDFLGYMHGVLSMGVVL